MATHYGECFCGAVKVEVSGEPEGMGYCHCRSCRSWSGGPVNAFTLWKPDAVRITTGAEHVGMYHHARLSTEVRSGHRPSAQPRRARKLTALPVKPGISACSATRDLHNRRQHSATRSTPDSSIL